MPIRFSKTVGFYQEGANTFWLSKNARSVIESDANAEGRASHILLKFTSGPRELYAYFPQVVHVYLNGRCREILEFKEPFETHEVVVSLHEATAFSVHAEQGSIPKQKGIAPDERELSILLAWELTPAPAGDLPPLRVSATPEFGSPHESCPALQYSRGWRPIFVVGMYRSGTSILTWAIGQHPNIFPL
jgi:hypothetical protein